MTTLALAPTAHRAALSGEAGSSAARAHANARIHAFTRLGAAPRATFPLALLSVTVAVLSLHADMVAKYSAAAYWTGVAATLGLAVGVGYAVSAMQTPGTKILAALGLPTLGGALVGMLVQAIVLEAVVNEDSALAVRDLGGLVDSTQPALWIAAGVVLGAVPALAVSAFLLLAARALRRLAGNDAAEGFGVAFTGGAGLFAAFGLVLVDPWEMPLLFVVVGLAGCAVLVAFLVDGARLGFLEHVFAGGAGAGAGGEAIYEIVPSERFRHDPALAPMVAQASAVSVLVRVERRLGSYRDAAAEPIALLADTLAETTAPIRKRRLAAAALLVAMSGLAGLSLLGTPDARASIVSLVALVD